MALPDHVIDVIDNDAIVLQSMEANATKVEECLVATIKIGVSCSLDSPPQRMKIEIVVNELQRILDLKASPSSVSEQCSFKAWYFVVYSAIRYAFAPCIVVAQSNPIPMLMANWPPTVMDGNTMPQAPI
ncbi:hypothetical protein Tco_1014275 [Tanacetum coccineum]